MTRYRPTHESQYGADRSARTRASGCTWTSAAIGVDAQSGGFFDPEPDEVLRFVKPSEETSPLTPGWSLADAALAMRRMGVPFAVRSGEGWGSVKAYRANGFGVLLQGDSDRFDGGCSGAFDGDHAIYLPPDVTATTGKWGIHDPICPGLTYQSEVAIRAYAEKFRPDIAFGVFTVAVPETGDDVGLRFRILAATDGIATVKGDGHSIIRVFDGSYVPVPKGQRREVVAKVELLEPLDANPGDRRSGYLVGKTTSEPSNYEAAFVLASDVTVALTPTSFPFTFTAKGNGKEVVIGTVTLP